MEKQFDMLPIVEMIEENLIAEVYDMIKSARERAECLLILFEIRDIKSALLLERAKSETKIVTP